MLLACVILTVGLSFPVTKHLQKKRAFYIHAFEPMLAASVMLLESTSQQPQMVDFLFLLPLVVGALVIPKLSNKLGLTLEVVDDFVGFDFEDPDRTEKDDGKPTPTYLLSGILAGLQKLPSEKKLRGESGFGRRIQYKSYRRIDPEWIPILTEEAKDARSISPFESISSANIARIVDTVDDDAALLGTFRLFKFVLKSSVSKQMNLELLDPNANGSNGAGMRVSNVGGFHGITDFFGEEGATPLSRRMGQMSSEAVQIAEQHDFDASTRVEKSNSKNRIRALDAYATSEAWVNVNNHGNWNSLHTHVGAAWSGIYYVQSNADSMSTSYSGNLVLKPSPHLLENLILDPISLGRLNVCDRSEFARRNAQPRPGGTRYGGNGVLVDKKMDAPLVPPSLSCCDYVEISAEAGTLYVIPSWLHHAVLPLSVKPKYRNTPEGSRISLAFNFIAV